MTSLYEDPFIEVFDRLMQTGLDWDEACMLIVCFLQERREMEVMIHSLPN